MPGGQPLQLDAPNAGNRVLLDDQLVAVGRGGAHAGLGVELIPGAQPACYGVLIRRSADIQTVGLLQRPLEFFLDLRLGSADDPLAGLGVVSGGVPALPVAIFPFSDTRRWPASLPYCSPPLQRHKERIIQGYGAELSNNSHFFSLRSCGENRLFCFIAVQFLRWWWVVGGSPTQMTLKGVGKTVSSFLPINCFLGCDPCFFAVAVRFQGS